MKTRFWFIAAMVGAATAMRLFPHPPNFTPIAAIALFGGAHFERRSAAFGVPLIAMLASDAIFQLAFGWGFHSLLPVVYLSFAAIVAMGIWLKSRRDAVSITAAVILAPTLFFLTTNFAVWAMGSMYPHTTSGLLACYLAAIPFYGWSLAGCIAYSAVLFGGFAFAEEQFRELAS